MDTAMADILSRTQNKVLVRVPEDTKVVKVIGVTNPQISCLQGMGLQGTCEFPVEDGHSPVCVCPLQTLTCQALREY